MYINESGPADGPTIMFLHGNGASGAMWKDHMKYFRGYHCMAPDFPGFGKSNGQEWVSLDASADQIIEIIKGTRSGRAHLVGLSLGGSVAITVLAKRPDLLDHVIIDGAGVLPLPGVALMKMSFWLMQPFLHTEFVIKTIAGSIKLPDEEYPEFKQNMLLMSPTSFRRSFIQALSLRQPDGLEKISNPVLFVAGAKEADAVKQSGRLLAKVIPKGECRIAPNMGHGWLAEDSRLHCMMVEAWITGKDLPETLIAP